MAATRNSPSNAARSVTHSSRLPNEVTTSNHVSQTTNVPAMSIDVATDWCPTMGLTSMPLFSACALAGSNLAVADALQQRQADRG